MFSGIGIENFRVFKNMTEFDFAPITLLTGANNSGKSSLIKALLLLKSGLKNNLEKLDFKGSEHKLGSFEIAKNRDNGEDAYIGFTLKYSNVKLISVPDSYFSIVLLLIQNDAVKKEIKKEIEKAHPYFSASAPRYYKKDGENAIFYCNLPSFDIVFNNSNNKVEDIVFNESTKEFENEEDFIDKYAGAILTSFIKAIVTLIKHDCIDEIIFLDLLLTIKIKVIENSELDNTDELNKQELSQLIELLEKNLKIYHVLTEKKTILSLIFLPDFKSDIVDFGVFSDVDIDAFTERLKTSLFAAILIKTIPIYSTSEYDDFMLPTAFFDYASIISLLKTVASVYNSLHEEYPEYLHLLEYHQDIEISKKNRYQLIRKSCLIEGDNYSQLWNSCMNFLYHESTCTYSSYHGDLGDDVLADDIHLDYIGAARANTQRVYQDLPQGTVFNELLNQYREFDFEGKETAANFVNNWLQKFGIGEKIDFQRIEGFGTVIKIIKNGIAIDLADLGFGITQLIPLLMKIAICKADTILIVEEPENSLHPNFQAQLADMFLDAYQTLNIRFIIESHSEYLIRKLQVMTKRSEITTTDSVIYYFKNPETLGEEESNVNKITIDENGELNGGFGEGFMDEAESLAWELFNTSKKRMS